MIKLMVTDLDGCLLDGSGRLPGSFSRALALAREKNVTIAAASGRSIRGVRMPLGSLAEEIVCIADNGACAFQGERTLFCRTLPAADYAGALDEARRHEGLISVQCGIRDAYIENADRLTEEQTRVLHNYYPVWKCLYRDGCPERLVKTAFLYLGDIEKDIYPFMRRFDGKKLCVQVTAYMWIDVYEKGISKGEGTSLLQRELGVTPEETVVFGDYINDLSLAGCAIRSFAPENAHPEVKRRFTDIIGPNTEGSVAETMIRLLEDI